MDFLLLFTHFLLREETFNYFEYLLLEILICFFSSCIIKRWFEYQNSRFWYSFIFTPSSSFNIAKQASKSQILPWRRWRKEEDEQIKFCIFNVITLNFVIKSSILLVWLISCFDQITEHCSILFPPATQFIKRIVRSKTGSFRWDFVVDITRLSSIVVFVFWCPNRVKYENPKKWKWILFTE